MTWDGQPDSTAPLERIYPYTETWRVEPASLNVHLYDVISPGGNVITSLLTVDELRELYGSIGTVLQAHDHDHDAA